MKPKHSMACCIMGILALGAAQAAGHAGHHHHAHGQQAAVPAHTQAEPPAMVSVEGCWIRALPAHLPSAAYFKVRNGSDQAIALQGLSTEAFGHAMLHVTHEERGMSKMAHAGAINIPAKGEFAFTTANGYHAMLEQSRRPLAVGATETLSFQFDRGAPVAVSCTVKSPSALE